MNRPENTVEPMYTLRTIAFRGSFVTILCQNGNTSCSLLALCNYLILLGEFCLNVGNLSSGDFTISEEELIQLVCDHYMTKARVKGSKTRKTAKKTLRRLAQPIHCNMMLTSVEHMEPNEELKLFEQLGIKVFHGYIVDPMEVDLVRAIGTSTYDTLLAGLGAHKAKTDVHSHSSGSSCVDESSTSHLEAANWDLIDEFFAKNPTQLTAYGFQSLKKHMMDNDTTLSVLFWNHHFHVVLQLHGKLLLLHYTSDQIDNPIAWREFDNVNGDGLSMDSKFLPAQTAPGATVSDGSWTQQKAGNDYVAKSVDFRGCRKFIIYSVTTGSCALVALCNAILLRGDVELSKICDCNSSLNLQHLHKVVLKGRKTHTYTMRPEEWIAAAGYLHQPVHVNMNFRNIHNIKITKDLKIFENFGFPLCHGFIADPEDLNLCNAIGGKYYDVATESPTSQLEGGDNGKLVDDFVKKYETELTPYGLQTLQKELESDVSVIFWNKQLHVAIKWNNRIFVLDPNLSSFDEGKIWRALDNVDALASILHPICEPKCTMPDCLLTFTSSFNLQRHNYVHHTSSASKALDKVKHRNEHSSFWDSLSSEEASAVLSLEDMKFQDMKGSLIVRVLEQRSPEGYKVGTTLLSSRSLCMKGEKIMSEVLFAILDEASENTFLCSDIRNCKDEIIWDGKINDIITDMHSLLACYSYLFEKALVDKWLKHKEAVAFKVAEALANKVAEDLIAEEKSAIEKEGNVQSKQGKQSNNSTGPHDGPSVIVKEDNVQSKQGKQSNNSTGPHDGPPLEGTGEVAEEDRVQDVKSLEHPDDDNIGNLHDLVLDFLKRFRIQAPKKFYRGTVEAMKYMEDLSMHIHFPHIQEYSGELAAYIIDHYDSDRAKSDISHAAAHYLIEHDLGKSEKEIHEGINVTIVDLPSPASNMSFKKYARLNKLIRPFKLPKKFRRLFSLHWKGRLFIMTFAGRRAARGFMNFIIAMHKRNLCWRGEWKISHMRMRDGVFIIDTEALYPADVDGMAEDFKKYIELLNPYYVIVIQSSCISPPYWEILQTDTMVIPNPSDAPEKFANFLKYMSAHFAFMPPVSIYQFLCLLFNICDGLRPKSEKYFQPLNFVPMDLPGGWTLKAMGAFLFCDIFFYSRNGFVVNVYSNTYWHLLQYTRHFSSHILSLTKNIHGQDVEDMIIIHLMLASRLDVHLASLVRHIVNETNMQGLYFRAWEALLASDDKTEENDLLENLEVSESEDEDDDTVVEETSEKIEDEDISQDCEKFKSEDEE